MVVDVAEFRVQGGSGGGRGGAGLARLAGLAALAALDVVVDAVNAVDAVDVTSYSMNALGLRLDSAVGIKRAATSILAASSAVMSDHLRQNSDLERFLQQNQKCGCLNGKCPTRARQGLQCSK